MTVPGDPARRAAGQDALQGLAARLGGRAVALDICAEDAPAQLVEALPEGVDIVVHNAGITRDKTLAKMSDAFWDSVINVRCFVAVAFWNMLGAGVFGFMINPPISLYYIQGL